MKISLLFGVLAASGLAITMGQMNATALPGDEGDGGAAAGPDVIVGSIHNVGINYGAVGGIMAYSFGTTSCNIGTQQLLWYDSDPDGAGPITASDHPTIPQNAYRVKNGRIQQIGASWCKHGFCALQGTLCGSCTPAGSGCPNLLGIGCSDPYDASLNGSYSGLGPRSQINPTTGLFPFPFTAPSSNTTIGRKCQINGADLNPALNAGAVYFAECMYIHRQDAQGNNDNNNASYRKFTVGTLQGNGTYSLALTGSTIQQKAAIYAWKDVHADVLVSAVDGADGRYMVAYRVTNNGNGTWHYEYAVENLNSDASGAYFSLPLPAGVVVSNAGFSDIAAHSGEPYNSIDWTVSTTGGQLRWSCTETFAANANANALRWGTMYNFWFDASTAPTTAAGSIGLFKTPGSAVAFTGLAPSAVALLGDLNNDGLVDGTDLGLLLGQWGGTGSGDLNNDGIVDGTDLGMLLAAWS